MSNPTLLTPAQIGQIYDVTSDTVLKWYHSGVIPAEVAQGQVYRFSADEVAAALKRNALKKAKKSKSPFLA